MTEPYRNAFTLRHDGKGIPYGGSGLPRNDGSANHGFRNVKANPALIDTLPELVADEALKAVVTAINRDDGGLLSIGCESGPVVSDEGHRYSGYIEFSFDSSHVVGDPTNYFRLFFHFDRHLLATKFAHPVQFEWELQPALFVDSGVNGFTCSVFVNTHFFKLSGQAQACWVAALAALEGYLPLVPVQPGAPLFA